MENLGKAFLAIILIACGFLLSMLSTYIIVDLADLFAIPQLKDFSFLQVFGLCIIIGIIKYKPDTKSKEEKSFSGSLLEGFIKLFGSAIFYLLAWGITYITFLIIK